MGCPTHLQFSKFLSVHQIRNYRKVIHYLQAIHHNHLSDLISDSKNTINDFGSKLGKLETYDPLKSVRQLKKASK